VRSLDVGAASATDDAVRGRLPSCKLRCRSSKGLTFCCIGEAATSSMATYGAHRLPWGVGDVREEGETLLCVGDFFLQRGVRRGRDEVRGCVCEEDVDWVS
jgi:hypothetical protein